MPELNHFRSYEIAQDESGDPLELAREGDQVVCLGFDTARGRFVEIVALAGSDTGEFLQRAELAARVRHPSLSQVTGYGMEEAVAFCAVDLVDGEPLGSFSARVGSIPFEAAASWLRQIAGGLVALDREGLVAPVGKARLCLAGAGKVSVRLSDLGIAKWGGWQAAADERGGEFARFLRSLTNYQGAGEEPVYPPETQALADRLESARSAQDCLDLLVAAGAPGEPPRVGEAGRPKLLLESLMFRRARPEHMVPAGLRTVRRAGGGSPYDSIVEDAAGERSRMLVLPPARFVSERLLDVFEGSTAGPAISSRGFWKHEDFRLLAEPYRPGFPLSDWIQAQPVRGADEVVWILSAVDRAVTELEEAGGGGRSLRADDVLIEYPGAEERDLAHYIGGGLADGGQVPEIRIRTHPTMRRLAGPATETIPDGAEELLADAEEGEEIDAAQTFAWYFNLRNRGLSYQAAELVESLSEAVGFEEEQRGFGEVALLAGGGEGAAGDIEEQTAAFSPIAAALGLDDRGTDPEGRDFAEAETDGIAEAATGADPFTNPIAQNVGTRDQEARGGAPVRGGETGRPRYDEDDPEVAGDEISPFAGSDAGKQGLPEQRESQDLEDLLGVPTGANPESAGRGASILFLFLILMLSVAIAAAIAHISGRAFWQQ